MSVAATYAQILAIVGAVSGITSAPTKMPAVLNDVDLPCALCIPEAAEWREQATGLFRQDRTYRLKVLVKPTAQGAGVDEGFQEVIPILNAVGDAFNRDLDLGNTVDHISEIRDTGVRGDVEWAGIPYHGFEITFRVTEKSP